MNTMNIMNTMNTNKKYIDKLGNPFEDYNKVHPIVISLVYVFIYAWFVRFYFLGEVTLITLIIGLILPAYNIIVDVLILKVKSISPPKWSTIRYGLNLLLLIFAAILPKVDYLFVLSIGFLITVNATADPALNLSIWGRLLSPLYIIVLFFYGAKLYFFQHSGQIYWGPYYWGSYYIAMLLLLMVVSGIYMVRSLLWKYYSSALNENREIETIFSIFNEGMIVFNEKGFVKKINQAAKDMFEFKSNFEESNCSLEEIINKIVSIDQKAFLLEDHPLTQVQKTGQPIKDFIARIKQETGVRYIRINAKVYMNDQLKSCMALSINDVTELYESTYMLDGFFKNSDQGMAVLNEGFEVVQCNSSLLNHFRVQNGQSIYKWIYPEDVIYFQQAIEKAKASNVGFAFLRWAIEGNILYNIDLAVYWSQNLNKFLIQVHDVTELRNLYSKQKTIMNALGQSTAISITDQEGKIIEINDKFETQSGYSRLEICGGTHSKVRSGLHDNSFYSDLLVTLKKGQVWSGEIANKNKNNKIYWVFITIAPIIDDLGHIVGYVSLSQDISILKSAQAQAIHAGKMATLGEMASGIAHEINNPLAVISGRLNLIKKRLEPLAEEACLQVVTDSEKMLTQVDRITKIINGLRSFARATGHEAMQLSSLNQIIVDSLELVQERFRKDNVEIKQDFFDDIQIMCRPIEISQVIVNLLNNAFDAIRGLENKWIQIEIDCSNSLMLLIKIIDSGLGISDELVEKIMEPFFTTKEVGKGTGLGLSISKGIMESHKGKLIYQLSPEGHTQFILELPKTKTV